MFGFLVFVTLLTLLVVIGVMFVWGRTRRTTGRAGNQRRHRAEARHLQARFETDDDFAQNFQRPTQNEVLESLQMLDHLSPDWEKGDAILVDRRLKNELAESFPTLRRGGCAYPQDIPEDNIRLFGETRTPSAKSETRVRSHQAQVALARQKFRAEQAQANARLQLASDPDVGPMELAPGSLPFRVAAEVQPNRSIPVIRWLGVSTAALILTACGWYLAGQPRRWTDPTALIASVIHQTPSAHRTVLEGSTPPRLATPIPTATPNHHGASGEANIARNQPASSLETVPASAAESPAPAVMKSVHDMPVVVVSPVPAAAETILAERIAESKVRAVNEYPDLAVSNSEINLRFVFRYKALAAERSPRLRDPAWPEKLAEECAKAAGAVSKSKTIMRTGTKSN